MYFYLMNNKDIYYYYYILLQGGIENLESGGEGMICWTLASYRKIPKISPSMYKPLQI